MLTLSANNILFCRLIVSRKSPAYSVAAST